MRTAGVSSSRPRRCRGTSGTVAGAALAATDVTALSSRLDECEEQRSLANALLAVHRADGTDAADRLLAAALRLTGSRYGAVLRVDGDALTPLAISPALADADLAVLVGDAVQSGVPAVREAAPDAPLPLRRILAVPVGENGVVAVADRSTPYTDREVALVRALAEEGFEAAARSAAAAMTAARADAFEALFAAAPLPLVLAGRDGGIRHENDAARALFGESAPESLALRVAGPDRNRVATTEERRRRGARGVPARYRAAVLDANGAEHPCLIAAVYRRQEEATLLAFVDLGPAAGFDACRDRALAALEARLEARARLRRRRPGRVRRGGPRGLAGLGPGTGRARRADPVRGAPAGLRGLLLIDPDEVARVADRELLRPGIGRDDPVALEELAFLRLGIRDRARRHEDADAADPADQVAAVRRDHVLDRAAHGRERPVREGRREGGRERAGAEVLEERGPGSDHGEDADEEEERAPLLWHQHTTKLFVVILNITDRFKC